MHVVKCGSLKRFWEKHQDSAEALKTWCKLLKGLNFKDFHELKEYFGSADQLGDGRVVFNIKGNKYRIVARINYTKGRVSIRFIGTHDQYNRINASII
jgi:mRNA interferase HigB